MLDEGDVDARVWIRIREVEQSLPWSSGARTASQRPDRVPIAAVAGPREGMALVEGFAATSSSGCGSRRPGRPLPSSRSVLVSMAAARSGHRRQHRRRLPALQQIVQLFLFRAGPVGEDDAQTAFQKFCRSPLTERAPSDEEAASKNSPRPCSAPPGEASAEASQSAKSMPGHATVASWRSMR